jgi:hypothetical protein
MKLVTTEAVMTALCQHCDSHIEMCEECGMREIVESVPSAWISVKDRLPEKSGKYLTIDMDRAYPTMYPIHYSAKWRGWNCLDYTDGKLEARMHEMHVTHWMPLPDAPEVEG